MKLGKFDCLHGKLPPGRQGKIGCISVQKLLGKSQYAVRFNFFVQFLTVVQKLNLGKLRLSTKSVNERGLKTFYPPLLLP